jgi:hypothetical protein
LVEGNQANKEDKGETQDSIKFGVNLSFKPRLSSVYFFHCVLENLTRSLYGQQKVLVLGFPYFAVITNFYF